MKQEYTNKSVKDAWLRASMIREKEYEIRIWVPKEHRGKGIGKGLLKDVTKDADNEGITLYAEPMPEEPDQYTEEEWEEQRRRLIHLYKKFGFMFEIIEGWGKMIRRPNKKLN